MAQPRRYPVSPKAYGGLFGAGSGNAVAAALISILEQQVTHAPLASGWVDAIYLGLGTATAWLGAWLAPHQPRPGDVGYVLSTAQAVPLPAAEQAAARVTEEA